MCPPDWRKTPIEDLVELIYPSLPASPASK
jgi:hypothetical protein